ncbi:uncharacterized protein TNCV_785721 [Trichonephila clavipes]|nr:uncharacterized protein TNCV_785721 [Trichonephila clavipes]
MTRKKDLSPDEIAYLFRELSENESDGGELSCSNLDSDEDIRLSESDREESQESADEILNILVNPNIIVTRDGTEWIQDNCVMFLADLRVEIYCDKAVGQQASRDMSTSFFMIKRVMI